MVVIFLFPVQAVLKPKDSCAVGVGGTGALNITGTQIWFQIDLHNVSDAVTVVELIGPATAGKLHHPYVSPCHLPQGNSINNL